MKRLRNHSDVAGVVDSWAKSHGTESDMFTEEQTQEVDDLRQQIDELQQQQDELSRQIQSTRREHYGYPHS
jgi:peptidoglycan hydrolase CwlO-like protein